MRGAGGKIQGLKALLRADTVCLPRAPPGDAGGGGGATPAAAAPAGGGGAASPEAGGAGAAKTPTWALAGRVAQLKHEGRGGRMPHAAVHDTCPGPRVLALAGLCWAARARQLAQWLPRVCGRLAVCTTHSGKEFMSCLQKHSHADG